MASTVTVTREEEVRVGNCPDYDDSTLVESNHETYLVGKYNSGTVDVCPLTEDDVPDEYDYVAGNPMTFSESAVDEVVEFVTP